MRIVQDAVESSNPSGNPFDSPPSNRDSSGNPFGDASGNPLGFGSDSLVAKEYESVDTSSDLDAGPGLDYRGLVHRLMSVRRTHSRAIGCASHTEGVAFLRLNDLPILHTCSTLSSLHHKVCAGDEDGDCDDEAFLGEKAVPLQVRMPVATRMQALGYSSDKCTCYSHCSFLACHRRWVKIDPYETVVCWAKERGKCSGTDFE